MGSESFAAYMPYIRQRWLNEQRGWQVRRERAWASARRAAEILRSRFGAKKILAFGSLVRVGMYDERSDIDLAVEGVPPGKFFRAWADAERDSEFEIDLVDLSYCSASLEKEILRDGMPL